MMLLGCKPGKVTDSLNLPEAGLGQLAFNSDGTVWVYCEADAAINAMDVVIIHSDGGAQAITATLGAVGTGLGKTVGVVAETLSQSIATGDFFWACRYAPAIAGIKFNAVASVEDYEELYTSGTTGHLTDVFDGDQAVRGIVSTEADDVEPVGVINWPQLVDTLNA